MQIGKTEAFLVVFVFRHSRFHLLLRPTLFSLIHRMEDSPVSERKFTRRKGHWDSPQYTSSTEYFNRPTPEGSQRENWYDVTPYVAEFWCAVTSIPMLSAAIVNQNPCMFLAAFFSIASHTIPRKWVHDLDMIGAALMIIQILRFHMIFVWLPDLFIQFVMLGVLLCLDVMAARAFGFMHVHLVWHLGVAYFANGFCYYINMFDSMAFIADMAGAHRTLSEAWAAGTVGL